MPFALAACPAGSGHGVCHRRLSVCHDAQGGLGFRAWPMVSCWLPFQSLRNKQRIFCFQHWLPECWAKCLNTSKYELTSVRGDLSTVTLASVLIARLLKDCQPLFYHQVPPCFPQSKCFGLWCLEIGERSAMRRDTISWWFVLILPWLGTAVQSQRPQKHVFKNV